MQGQLCTDLWESHSRPGLTQHGIEPGSVVTLLALRCSVLDDCTTQEPHKHILSLLSCYFPQILSLSLTGGNYELYKNVKVVPPISIEIIITLLKRASVEAGCVQVQLQRRGKRTVAASKNYCSSKRSCHLTWLSNHISGAAFPGKGARHNEQHVC